MNLANHSYIVCETHFMNSSISTCCPSTDSVKKIIITITGYKEKLIGETDCNLFFQGLRFLATLGIFKIQILCLSCVLFIALQ